MKIIATLISLTLALKFFSQPGNTLFGLARTTNPTSIYLATIDPVSGIVSNVSQNAVASSINLTGAALNPYSNRFCFFGDNGLLSINLSNGQLSNTTNISNPNGAGYFDLFRFNTADSLLYGLSRRNVTNPQTGVTTGTIYLATIDETTGIITEISNNSIGQSFALSGSAIDPHQMVFYYSNGSQLVGIDMYNGNVFSNPSLTFPIGGMFFDNFTYNCADTTIYGLLRSNYYSQIYDPILMTTTQVFDSTTVHLGKVDPLSGVVTKIGSQSLGISSFSLNGSSTIDPVNLIYYFVSGTLGNGNSIFGVSLQTGLIVSQGAINASGTSYFDMMRVQSDCYQAIPNRLPPMASLTELSSKKTEVVVFPNPFNDYVTVKSEVALQTIQLYQADGTLLHSEAPSALETTFETKHLAHGIYFLHIITPNEKTSVKIIK